MITRINEALPSTGPPLDAETICTLPGWPILHLTPRAPMDVRAGTHHGVREVDGIRDLPGTVWVARWVPDEEGGYWGEPETGEFDSFEDLCQSHDVRYLRLPRLSCSATVEAIETGRKTVTRRLALPRGIVPGALINLTDGARRPGVRVLAVARVLSVIEQSTGALSRLDAEELAREGFPGKTPDWFEEMFRSLNGLDFAEYHQIWRISFEYLTEGLGL